MGHSGLFAAFAAVRSDTRSRAANVRKLMSKFKFDITPQNAYSDRMTKQGVALKSRSKAARKTVASPVRSGATGAKSARVKAPAPAAAKAKATTIRLNPELQMGLELLQGVLHKPVNKMVNEAVAIFVSRRKAKVEADLEGVLAKLKAYKRQDPDFEQAIQQFAEAEASLGGDDPVEGTVSRAESRELGPTQKMVRQLLDG